MPRKTAVPKTVATLTHDEAMRKNIPTAEHQSVIEKAQESPRTLKYPRNTDLDPQLVWRGKGEVEADFGKMIGQLLHPPAPHEIRGQEQSE